MINTIVFSKDRAAQLELFLRTMKYHFREFDAVAISIIYTYSDIEYEKGYNKLISEYKKYSNLIFIKESDFKKNVLASIDSDYKYTVFFVDDNVFINDFSIYSSAFKSFEDTESNLCISLRLNPNINFCYPANIQMRSPNIYYKVDNYNMINWMNERNNGCYGYPMSVDGNVYKTSDISNYIKLLNFSNPNSFEAAMAANPLLKSTIIFYNDSIIFNNPINKVQTNNPNRHGNIDSRYINEMYLSDYRIKNSFTYLKNTACHVEIPIEFEKI